MPYVKPERRPALDKVVDELIKLNVVTENAMYHLITDTIVHSPKYKDLDRVVRDVLVQPNGDINYILFKYCKHHIKPSYNNYKEFMGMIYQIVDSDFNRELRLEKELEYKNEFREAAEWIRIKLLIPYEERKLLENGDI